MVMDQLVPLKNGLTVGAQQFQFTFVFCSVGLALVMGDERCLLPPCGAARGAW